MIFPIRTENLSKTFRGVSVVTHLNLEVPEGGIYGLIGPNGAGKTTTIQILMNILRPASGRAEVFGVESTRLSARELTQIGYVAEGQELPGGMTVESFLSYLKPFYPTWDDALAREMVRNFELPLARTLSKLSHGMRMKTALTSSLAYHPRLLILDEPFTGLDPLVRDELVEGILASAEYGTILISSHELSDIETFLTHVGYLDRGCLRFSEDMNAVAKRFREIEILTDSQAVPQAAWPAAWLNVESSDGLVRCVDTQFEPDRTMAEVHRLFGDVRHVDARPMPLRSIFVTLAKAARKEA